MGERYIGGQYIGGQFPGLYSIYIVFAWNVDRFRLGRVGTIAVIPSGCDHRFTKNLVFKKVWRIMPHPLTCENQSQQFAGTSPVSY